jgi:putative FmdB family regulatory protein
MPTYEYECRDCSVRFERMQRFSDEPVKTCPECGGMVRRVLHPVGIVFRGSGWYITDSRKSDSSTSTADDKPKDTADSATPKSEKSETSDTKPTAAAGV